MERSAIKSFAIWARRHLQEQVTARLKLYGITAATLVEPQLVAGGLIVLGETLDAVEAGQYGQLREHLKDLMGGCAIGSKRYEEAIATLIDEIAYTWFNRLAALRYMEVNGYLGQRVLSSGDVALVDPEIWRSASEIAAGGGLPGLSSETLEGWRSAASRAGNPDEFVYRKLLGVQCGALSGVLPFLFDRNLDFTGLFLPGNLLNRDSIIRRFVADIPEEDWRDAADSENGVEIIGWLYQFYISERKDEVIGAKSKIAARDIPAATQLFTPHWIVRYMVENSLGRLWLESHPESGLRSVMKYYLESPSEDSGERVSGLEPQDLTVMDPACGSGHILVYAFDLLLEIYKEQGYREREIPALILTHNLHGLDIDARAVQLASFAVLMKARAKNSRLFRDAGKMPTLNIVMVKSTKALLSAKLAEKQPVGDWKKQPEQLSFLPGTKQLGFGDVQPEVKGEDAGIFSMKGLVKADWQPLLEAFAEAENLGSLITPPEFDGEKLLAQVDAFAVENSLFGAGESADALREVVRQAVLLRKQYWVVVANPPYMGNKSLNNAIQDFAKKHYPDSKSDAFAMFIERINQATCAHGKIGLISPFVWMFLSTYEKFRTNLLNNFAISSLIQLEYNAFEPACIPVCTFTLDKPANKNQKGTYIKLSDFRGHQNQAPKTLEAIDNPNCGYLYHAKAADFGKIPGSPIAYWLSQKILNVFEKGEELGNIAAPRKGNTTTCNDRFLRLWYEPSYTKVALNYKTAKEVDDLSKKWVPYNKGGGVRKWYGFCEYTVNWEDAGAEIKEIPHSVIANEKYFMKPGWTWSTVTSSIFSMRKFSYGFIFDNGGCCLFADQEIADSLGALLNSIVFLNIFGALNPTLNFQSGEVAKFPVLFPEKEINNKIIEATQKCVSLSQEEWDTSETSWGFLIHFLVGNSTSLAKAFSLWEAQSEDAFQELKRLEEENNRYWIEAYGLQSELTPEVPDDQITIRRAELDRDIRSFISYAVGCMMGRYSLDTPGLIHAGQPFDPSRHTTFPADQDAILPITDQAYFDDDIVTRFITFVATALTLKAGETARDRIRRYFLTEFITDHIKTYKKRPIYWLFTSGKKRAFSALVYLHRYSPDTVGRLRTDYVLELQVKLDQEIDRLTTELTNATSTPTKKAATTRLKTLQAQQLELRDYQAKLQTVADQRIAIDLDDGVAYNYTRFKGLVYEGTDLKMADLEAKVQWKLDLLKKQGAGTA